MNQKITFGIYGAPTDTMFGVTLPYIEFMTKFYGYINSFIEIINPFSNHERQLRDVDVLIVPGGHDIDPHRYLREGERVDLYTGKPNIFYEDLDLNFLKRWLHLNKPTIGICRGMQTLNVILGGTLYQHITGHRQSDERNITKYETKVIGFDGETKYIKINSLHHQAVRELANGLKPIAWGRTYVGCPTLSDPEKLYENWKVKVDKNKYDIVSYPVIIEGFVHEELPIIGVQWHPEEFDCEFTLSYINHFIQEYVKQKENTGIKEKFAN